MKYPVSAFFLLSALSAAALSSVHWQNLPDVKDADGHVTHVVRLTVTPDPGVVGIAFNRSARNMRPVNTDDSLLQISHGYYELRSRRLKSGKQVVFDLRSDGPFSSTRRGPEGFHAVMADGSTRPVSVTSDALVDGDIIRRATPPADLYALNESLRRGRTPGPYDVIPSFKSVVIDSAVSVAPLDMRVEYVPVSGCRPGWSRVTVAPGLLRIEAAEGDHAAVQQRMERSLWGYPSVPAAVIEDWPDYQYRGLMIDIARNYQTPAAMRRMVDAMALFGFNTLHFHFSDDEGWRLEIPGLPELTEVGARRGYTRDESDFLSQIFTGDGDPDSHTSTANGYFTTAEFIDFLKYAHARGVQVIPEIEAPGHARAAIKAMEHRWRTTGDDTYRLIDPADSASYTSVQSYHDNVMNPGVPGPVRFMGAVADALQQMYADAGLRMPALHIGGDEVPDGAWDGSPAVRALRQRRHIHGDRRLHGFFVSVVSDSLSARGIPVQGWQEIALGHSPEYDAQLIPAVYGVNAWRNIGSDLGAPEQIARAGYPVILSNVTNCYMDMKYNLHPDELGQTWGGTVDEIVSLHGTRDRLCDVEDEFQRNIIGISGQLFSETIRSEADMQVMLLPKMLGLAERAWNADSTYTDADFMALISDRYLPYLLADGYSVHLRQPGAIVRDGRVMLNHPYPDSLHPVIRYTTDGTEPTETSPVYTAPFPHRKNQQIRAALYIAGQRSLTTAL